MLPKLLIYIRNKTLWKHISGAYRRVFTEKNVLSVKASHEQIQKPGKVPREVISDREFHDLVIKADGTETIMGSEEADETRQFSVKPMRQNPSRLQLTPQ